jgi:hypothetical protein
MLNGSEKQGVGGKVGSVAAVVHSRLAAANFLSILVPSALLRFCRHVLGAA